MNTIFTVGHSNHSADLLVDLLRSQQVEAIADVRSAPYSRYNPQFDRETQVDPSCGQHPVRIPRQRTRRP